MMAEALIKYETIDEEQLKDIMEGRTPKPPEDWDDSTPVPTSKPQDKPAPADRPCRRAALTSARVTALALLGLALSTPTRTRHHRLSTDTFRAARQRVIAVIKQERGH